MRIRAFSLRIFLILVLLPFLGGCATPYIFGPEKVGSSDYLLFKDKTGGGLGGDATGALYKRGTESVVVGWEHYFVRYDDFEVRIHNHVYRGGVKFRVGILGGPPATTVTKATLKYTIQDGAKSPSEGLPFPESCATKLLLAKGDWKGGPAVDPGPWPENIAGDPYMDGLPEKLIGSVISIDVTKAVKDWEAVCKKDSGKCETNFGFVFAGSKEEDGLPMNNDKCWTLLGDFTLTVDYTKP